MAILDNNSIRSHFSSAPGSNFNNRIIFQTNNGTTNAHYCRTHANFTHEGNQNNDILTGVGSFNVASIVELGVGVYQCNFTEPFFVNSYGVVAVAQHSRDINGNRIFFHLRDKQTTHIVLQTIGGNGESGVFRIMDASFAIFNSRTNSN